MIVDEMHEEHPELLRDQYWDEIVPKELPYTVGSEHYRKHEPKGSAENYKVKQNDAVYANISTAKGGEDVYADYVSNQSKYTAYILSFNLAIVYRKALILPWSSEERIGSVVKYQEWVRLGVRRQPTRPVVCSNEIAIIQFTPIQKLSCLDKIHHHPQHIR